MPTVFDRALYKDLARLNGELAASERRLTKTNFELDRANRELRALHEALPVGVFRADRAGRIDQANARFAVLTGAAVPDDWTKGVDPRDAARVEGLWREALAAGTGFRSEHRQKDRDIVMTTVAVHDTQGAFTGLVGVVTDVSERLLAEERGREIDRNGAIRQLTGGLAHNLNNIMMVILGTAERLSEELPPGDTLHAVAVRNMAATERAAALTRRLMIYAGLGVLSSSRIDVDAALEAIAREARAVPASRHAVSLVLGAPGAAVQFNADLFGEAVRELIANAQAAMPDGGTVRLSTRLSPDARRVSVTVGDDGHGMDSDTLKHAREPFFTTREVGQGIGLGLSLADGASRVAGGKLTLRSRVGVGTEAEIDLPVLEVAAGGE